MIHGLWSLIHGLWSMVFDPWSMICHTSQGNNQRGGHPMNYREREMIDKDVKVALNLELPQQQGSGSPQCISLSITHHTL